MRPTVFVINPDFADEILKSEELAPALLELGPPLVAGAQTRARKRLEKLADSIDYEVGHNDAGNIIGRLRADDFKAHWHEFGTAKKAAQPYLRPTVEELVGPVIGGNR